MTINERVKFLRKSCLGITQEEFSTNIRISRSNLGNIEIGRIAVTDRVISDICSFYKVSEKWLIKGDGDVFIETRESFITKICDENHVGKYARQILETYLSFDEKDKDAFERFIKYIANAIKSVDAEEYAIDKRMFSPSVENISELSDEEKVDLYRQRLKAAKKTNVSSTTSESA